MGSRWEAGLGGGGGNDENYYFILMMLLLACLPNKLKLII
jgi:hypothetical protein